MTKKSKSTNKSNQILTGHQLVAEIFGNKPQYISDVVNEKIEDKKGVKQELDLFAKFQKAYIKKRQIILGLHK